MLATPERSEGRFVPARGYLAQKETALGGEQTGMA
jgi:hypothetical protein